MTGKEFKKALEKYQIFVVGVQWTKNGWTGFRVYHNNGGAMLQITEKCQYWNEKKGFYQCRAWGTDRTLEIILSIGYALGLKFDEIRQSHRFLSYRD